MNSLDAELISLPLVEPYKSNKYNTSSIRLLETCPAWWIVRVPGTGTESFTLTTVILALFKYVTLIANFSFAYSANEVKWNVFFFM